MTFSELPIGGKFQFLGDYEYFGRAPDETRPDLVKKSDKDWESVDGRGRGRIARSRDPEVERR